MLQNLLTGIIDFDRLIKNIKNILPENIQRPTVAQEIIDRTGFELIIKKFKQLLDNIDTFKIKTYELNKFCKQQLNEKLKVFENFNNSNIPHTNLHTNIYLPALDLISLFDFKNSYNFLKFANFLKIPS